MSVFRRLAGVLALFVVAFVPRAAGAAPIPFDVALGIGNSFTGEFENLNDVALFRFRLIDGDGAYTFLATTDSVATGGFDPAVTLFLGTERYTYFDAAGLEFPAESDDTDTGLDASLSLVLTTPGVYTLALTHTQNFSHETLGFDWDLIPDVMGELYPGVTCEAGGPSFGPFCAEPTFAISIDVMPVASTPVPEPGTIFLLCAAISAIAIRRRRGTPQ